MRPYLLPLVGVILPLVATATNPNEEIPEDCPELRVNPASVPDDQNAHQILGKLPKPPRQPDYNPKHPESFLDLHYYWIHQANTKRPSGILIAKAKALLVRHAETMRRWDAALSAQHFIEPTICGFSDIDTTVPSNFAAMREALLGNLWRIRIATYEGRHADAFNDWLRLRTALLRQSEHCTTLVSGMIRSVGINLVNKEAWMLNPTADESRLCRPVAVRFPVAAYRSISRGEARFTVVAMPKSDAEIEMMLRWPLTKFAERGINTVADYRTKIQPALGSIATRCRETRDEIRRLERDGFLDPAVFKPRLAMDSAWNRRNRATEAFSDINIFDFAYFTQWADSVSCTQANLALALRAYAADHDGKLPPTLDVLVPQYADAIPADPFDGKPMRYDAKIPKIWSIGPDFTDNHGVCDNPPRRSDMTGDITLYPPNHVPARQAASAQAGP